MPDSSTVSGSTAPLGSSKLARVRSGTAAVAVVAAACAGIVFARAHASEATPVRVELDGHSGCPNATEFYARVRGRTAKIRLANQGEASRAFRVRLRAKGATTIGVLTIEDEHGTDTRTVTGASCLEVVDALALVAALSADPEATTVASALPPTEPSGSAPAAPETSTSPPAPPTTVVSASPSIAAPPPAPGPAPGPRSPEIVRRDRVSFGLGVDALSLDARGARLAPVTFVDWARPSASVLSPAVRLSLARTESDPLVTGSGTAELAWTWARLDACPLQLPRPPVMIPSIEVRACAIVAAGAVAARVSGIDNPTPRTRAWVSPGALLRLATFRLAPIALEAQVGALVPIVRQDFYFDPATPVHRLPAIVGFAGIAAGVSIP